VDGPDLKPLVVLGATGSIGLQTLEVARRLGVPVAAIAARRGSDDLMELSRQWPEAQVAVADPTAGERERFEGVSALFGEAAMAELAAMPGSTVVNAIVGAAGLEPSVSALAAGNRLALANKESMVAAGPLLKAEQKRSGAELIPIDSEHSALFQCLAGEDRGAVARLVLTASGGPFRGMSAEALEEVTLADALQHPTWDMGPRITIDSATLMNKALEVIEAHYLFDVDFDQIDVVVHPESIVHSLVEFRDGTFKADLGAPDMRVPIQYAITYPARLDGPDTGFDLLGAHLTFEPPDRANFPLLDLGYHAGREGGSAPASLNAADEIAVQAFRDGRIGFKTIARVVAEVLEKVEVRELDTVADVMDADKHARAVATELISVC
jgi:1-deoxy-D-xylulose-5-phosphate reductoisomerase